MDHNSASHLVFKKQTKKQQKKTTLSFNILKMSFRKNS